MDRFGVLDDVLRFKHTAIEMLSQIENVKIYDFQCDPWITDLNEYMDLRHHSHAYNRRIMEAIHDDHYRAVVDSLDLNDDKLRQIVMIYRDSLSTLNSKSFNMNN